MAQQETAAEKQGEGKSTLYKVVKTIFLILVWVCLGLYLEITGPTLKDLRIQTGADYEDIAFSVSGRSLGYFLGSAVGGVLVDRYGLFCELMVAVCLDGGAAATAVIPFVPTSWYVWALCICQGTFEGVINIAGQKLILLMWLEKAASPLHILHGGFGIGSFIIPLIANPFLAVPASDAASNHSNSSSFTTTAVSTTTGLPHSYSRVSRIEYPYIIAAAITASLSLVFYAYHVSANNDRKLRRKELKEAESSKEDSVPFRKMFNPATCAGGRFCYGVQIFSLVFIYFFIAVGGERVAGKFIRAYSIDELDFSNDDGSYINTIFWVSYSCGRFSGFAAARWIPIRVLIILETGGLLVSSIALVIFGGQTTPFWVVIQFLGFFTAPLFPSGIGWTDFHISMTGIAITTLLLGGSLGGIAMMRLIGFLYQHYGPKTYLYTLLGFGIAQFVMAVLMDIAGAQHGSRFAAEKKEELDVSESKPEQGKDNPMKENFDRL